MLSVLVPARRPLRTIAPSPFSAFSRLDTGPVRKLPGFNDPQAHRNHSIYWIYLRE